MIIPHLSQILTVLTVLSVITFLLSLFLIPWAICQMPADFFVQIDSSNQSPWTPGIFFRFLIKNFFGYLFLIAGVAMLFLPGQGILTILLGLLLISFPGKRAMIKSLVKRRQIQKSLNWIRTRKQLAPFLWPD